MANEFYALKVDIPGKITTGKWAHITHGQQAAFAIGMNGKPIGVTEKESELIQGALVKEHPGCKIEVFKLVPVN